MFKKKIRYLISYNVLIQERLKCEITTHYIFCNSDESAALGHKSIENLALFSCPPPMIILGKSAVKEELLL